MPAASRTHYRVLCVAPDASTEEIERSFRQLARRLHPDLNGGDGAAEEQMKELNVARTTLTDPTARAAYDQRLDEERRQAEREKAQQAERARAPVPARANEPLRAVSTQPLAPWMRARDIPPPPTPTERRGRGTLPESRTGSSGSLGRLFWISVVAAGGLTLVLLLIWLHQALEGAR